jgi:hypothetical protein
MAIRERGRLESSILGSTGWRLAPKSAFACGARLSRASRLKSRHSQTEEGSFEAQCGECLRFNVPIDRSARPFRKRTAAQS